MNKVNPFPQLATPNSIERTIEPIGYNKEITRILQSIKDNIGNQLTISIINGYFGQGKTTILVHLSDQLKENYKVVWIKSPKSINEIKERMIKSYFNRNEQKIIYFIDESQELLENIRKNIGEMNLFFLRLSENDIKGMNVRQISIIFSLHPDIWKIFKDDGRIDILQRYIHTKIDLIDINRVIANKIIRNYLSLYNYNYESIFEENIVDVVFSFLPVISFLNEEAERYSARYLVEIFYHLFEYYKTSKFKKITISDLKEIVLNNGDPNSEQFSYRDLKFLPTKTPNQNFLDIIYNVRKEFHDFMIKMIFLPIWRDINDFSKDLKKFIESKLNLFVRRKGVILSQKEYKSIREDFDKLPKELRQNFYENCIDYYIDGENQKLVFLDDPLSGNKFQSLLKEYNSKFYTYFRLLDSILIKLYGKVEKEARHNSELQEYYNLNYGQEQIDLFVKRFSKNCDFVDVRNIGKNTTRLLEYTVDLGSDMEYTAIILLYPREWDSNFQNFYSDMLKKVEKELNGNFIQVLFLIDPDYKIEFDIKPIMIRGLNRSIFYKLTFDELGMILSKETSSEFLERFHNQITNKILKLDYLFKPIAEEANKKFYSFTLPGLKYTKYKDLLKNVEITLENNFKKFLNALDPKQEELVDDSDFWEFPNYITNMYKEEILTDYFVLKDNVIVDTQISPYGMNVLDIINNYPLKKSQLIETLPKYFLKYARFFKNPQYLIDELISRKIINLKEKNVIEKFRTKDKFESLKNRIKIIFENKQVLNTENRNIIEDLNNKFNIFAKNQKSKFLFDEEILNEDILATFDQNRIIISKLSKTNFYLFKFEEIVTKLEGEKEELEDTLEKIIVKHKEIIEKIKYKGINWKNELSLDDEEINKIFDKILTEKLEEYEILILKLLINDEIIYDKELFDDFVWRICLKDKNHKIQSLKVISVAKKTYVRIEKFERKIDKIIENFIKLKENFIQTNDRLNKSSLNIFICWKIFNKSLNFNPLININSHIQEESILQSYIIFNKNYTQEIFEEIISTKIKFGKWFYDIFENLYDQILENNKNFFFFKEELLNFFGDISEKKNLSIEKIFNFISLLDSEENVILRKNVVNYLDLRMKIKRNNVVTEWEDYLKKGFVKKIVKTSIYYDNSEKKSEENIEHNLNTPLSTICRNFIDENLNEENIDDVLYEYNNILNKAFDSRKDLWKISNYLENLQNIDFKSNSILLKSESLENPYKIPIIFIGKDNLHNFEAIIADIDNSEEKQSIITKCVIKLDNPKILNNNYECMNFITKYFGNIDNFRSFCKFMKRNSEDYTWIQRFSTFL